MTIGSMLAVYFVVWWITLFAILPFGIRSQHEGGEYPAGSDPGAPVHPSIWKRVMWTTIVSAVVYAFGTFVATNGWFDIEKLARLMGMPN